MFLPSTHPSSRKPLLERRQRRRHERRILVPDETYSRDTFRSRGLGLGRDPSPAEGEGDAEDQEGQD